MSLLLHLSFEDGVSLATPNPVSVSTNLPEPTVVNLGNRTVFPQPLKVIGATTTGVVSNSKPIPAPVQGALIIPIPTVKRGKITLSPQPLSLGSMKVDPSAHSGRLIIPASLGVVLTIPAPAKLHTGEQIATPNAIAASLSIPVPLVFAHGNAYLTPVPLLINANPEHSSTVEPGNSGVIVLDEVVKQGFEVRLIHSSTSVLVAPQSIQASNTYAFASPTIYEETWQINHSENPGRNESGVETVIEESYSDLFVVRTGTLTIEYVDNGDGTWESIYTSRSTESRAINIFSVTITIPIKSQSQLTSIRNIVNGTGATMVVYHFTKYRSGSKVTRLFCSATPIVEFSHNQTASSNTYVVRGERQDYVRSSTVRNVDNYGIESLSHASDTTVKLAQIDTNIRVVDFISSAYLTAGFYLKNQAWTIDPVGLSMTLKS